MLITWKYDSDLYRILLSSKLLMKMMVVSRTESSFEILSIGINLIYFIGINQLIPYTVTVGLQMIISAHCHQITFESKVGDSLSLAPGSTPDVRHSSSSLHPGGFTPTPPSSITFWWPHIVFCSRDWIIRIRKKNFLVARSSKSLKEDLFDTPVATLLLFEMKTKHKNETSFFCCRNLPVVF